MIPHRGTMTTAELFEKDILCALLTASGVPGDDAERKRLVYEARLLASMLLEEEAPVDLVAAARRPTPGEELR